MNNFTPNINKLPAKAGKALLIHHIAVDVNTMPAVLVLTKPNIKMLTCPLRPNSVKAMVGTMAKIKNIIQTMSINKRKLAST